MSYHGSMTTNWFNDLKIIASPDSLFDPWIREAAQGAIAEIERLREQVARRDRWIAAANAQIRLHAVDEIAEGL